MAYEKLLISILLDLAQMGLFNAARYRAILDRHQVPNWKAEFEALENDLELQHATEQLFASARAVILKPLQQGGSDDLDPEQLRRILLKPGGPLQ